jgi:hypothetical protein
MSTVRLRIGKQSQHALSIWHAAASWMPRRLVSAYLQRPELCARYDGLALVTQPMRDQAILVIGLGIVPPIGLVLPLLFLIR